MKHILFLLLLILTVHGTAQSTGKILVITDMDADILVDGDKVASTTSGNACKLELAPGEHYVQARCSTAGNVMNNGQVVNVEVGKQQIIHINFQTAQSTPIVSSTSSDTVSIGSVDFFIAGSITVGLWLSDHPGEEYPDYPVYYYVLDKNDILLIDFRMDNKKGTNMISVASYPDGNQLYSDNNLVAAKNLRIKIPARGIYGISYSTNHVFDRSCNMSVKKIPGSAESKALSPAVGWESRQDTVFRWVTDTIVTSTYTPVSLQSPLKSWVNSGSNAFFGGRSRITIPIDLPANTVEWYYIVSAYRDEADMNRTMQTFGLLADVSKAIDVTGTAGFAISLLTAPPGADYCDVYLLDPVNRPLFYDHEEFSYIIEGTRLNVTNGLVKVSNCITGTYYLGLRNPDSYYGEFIAIEAVAITEKKTSETKRRKSIVRIADKKYPVMPG